MHGIVLVKSAPDNMSLSLSLSLVIRIRIHLQDLKFNNTTKIHLRSSLVLLKYNSQVQVLELLAQLPPVKAHTSLKVSKENLKDTDFFMYFP